MNTPNAGLETTKVGGESFKIHESEIDKINLTERRGTTFLFLKVQEISKIELCKWKMTSSIIIVEYEII